MTFKYRRNFFCNNFFFFKLWEFTRPSRLDPCPASLRQGLCARRRVTWHQTKYILTQANLLKEPHSCVGGWENICLFKCWVLLERILFSWKPPVISSIIFYVIFSEKSLPKYTIKVVYSKPRLSCVLADDFECLRLKRLNCFVTACACATVT